MNFMYGDGNNELTQKEQASHVSRFKNRLLILLPFSFFGALFLYEIVCMGIKFKSQF